MSDATEERERVQTLAIMDRSYCGCCSGDLDDSRSDWCNRCHPHVLSDTRPDRTFRPQYDRTYFAQFGRECPYQVSA